MIDKIVKIETLLIRKTQRRRQLTGHEGYCYRIDKIKKEEMTYRCRNSWGKFFLVFDHDQNVLYTKKT